MATIILSVFLFILFMIIVEQWMRLDAVEKKVDELSEDDHKEAKDDE